ncbi:serine threonine protein kinase [Diplodia corticola]|uniref:Serine threonine protein kinase n=1 Tax=Diplodia corticola TaxID=236234 RepID=A0A1J9RUG3_9PEZI|nr:serine threonine protein kinase [Diplodia corticola]OJD36219.1 serine threonine protein kinase [Diplodia corticola]
MATKIPGTNKRCFENAHSDFIKEQRGWSDAETKLCLEFLWYTVLSRDEKQRYDGKRETPFIWDIPYVVPPAYNKKAENQREREAFLHDPANYSAPSEGAGSRGADAEDTLGYNTTDEVRPGTRGTEREGSAQQNLPGEERPARGDSDEDSLTLNPAQKVRDLEAQLIELRQNNAFLSSNAPEQKHWPNLDHLPLPSSTDDGRKDPTGALRPRWKAQYQRFIRVHMGGEYHKRPNEDNNALGEAVAFEKMKYGKIEAHDGKQVLNHDGGKWVFERVLGQGGFGTVALWRKKDLVTEQVIDMVAVKEEETKYAITWTDPLYWRDSLPREISIHEHLKKINPPCPYLMSSRGYRLNLRQRIWRLYLPYKPGMTLKEPMKFKRSEGDSDIPLDFIFYTFLATAEACLALECGWWGGQENEPLAEVLEKTGGRRPGWIPIVHRDLKPGNIFLDREPYDAEAKWNMYPTPCVGDMGMAIEAYPDDPYNPENYSGSGTTEYMAPEQNVYRPLGVPFARKLSDRTNVFAIAASIFELWQGKLPGFTAIYDEEVDASEDDIHLPPNHDEDEIGNWYIDHHGQKSHNERLYRGRNPDEMYEAEWGRTLGTGAPHWVNLWELEKWKSDWLLPSIGKPDGDEQQPLQKTKEVELANILRQCLKWNADERPSILKLRNMVKNAIEELQINPSGADMRIIEPFEHGVEDGAQRLFPRVWQKGGLVFPMDDNQGAVSYVEALNEKMEQGYQRNVGKGLAEMTRRAWMQQLRPYEPQDAVAQESRGTSSKRRSATNDDNRGSSKRQKLREGPSSGGDNPNDDPKNNPNVDDDGDA